MSATRILIADDSSPIQKVIKIAFAKHPAEILIASSFVDALNESQKTRPNLVIFDAGLPGVNEPKDFLKIAQDVPCIGLLGSYERFSEADLRAQGFTNLLKKPFDGQDLVRMAESLVSFTAKDDAPPAASFVPPPPMVHSNPGAPVFRESSGQSQGFSSTISEPISHTQSTIKVKFDAPMPMETGSSFIGGGDTEQQIRKLVENYCEKHFKSIAREILTQELRRLAEEKSRILSDG